ncbi:hypothetical protein L1987_12679 [Smallanthus sonchifolius]|uniref:Uncharacterized protein n=1 Tax=Smallanthus sonchifolius TaxID=185202 RepID=A0ACB9JEE6_9ASTR|nr:hypothetical protein L1987_12679 [Smallanthus sonchifolius]
MCPTPLTNFSLHGTTFSYTDLSNDLFFFYNCSSPHNVETYSVDCASNGTSFSSFATFHPEKLASHNYSIDSCQKLVHVPGHVDSFSVLLYASYTDVLRNGFSLEWKCSNCETQGANQNLRRKVDFGLAKLYSRKDSLVSMLEARGTLGYIAPELYNKNFGRVSHKSDVYSYGMLLLEMVGGRENVDVGVGSSRTSEIYFLDRIYNGLHKDGVLLDSVTTAEENEYLRKMNIVGLWCIQLAPNQGPSINEVIDMLEGSMEALEVPPKPFICSPPRSPSTISKSMPEMV